MHSDWLGIVLCGGASRRMGQDKSTLTLHHQSFLQWSESRLRRVCGQVVIVGGTSASAIPDTQEHQGPVVALAHALLQLPPCWLLCTAVDTPLLTDADLQVLQHQATGAQRAAYFDQFFLPFVLHNSAETRQRIMAVAGRSQASQRSLRAMLLALNAMALPTDVELQQRLTGCNTPAAYQAILESLS